MSIFRSATLLLVLCLAACAGSSGTRSSDSKHTYAQSLDVVQQAVIGALQEVGMEVEDTDMPMEGAVRMTATNAASGANATVRSATRDSDFLSFTILVSSLPTGGTTVSVTLPPQSTYGSTSPRELRTTFFTALDKDQRLTRMGTTGM